MSRVPRTLMCDHGRFNRTEYSGRRWSPRCFRDRVPGLSLPLQHVEGLLVCSPALGSSKRARFACPGWVKKTHHSGRPSHSSIQRCGGPDSATNRTGQKETNQAQPPGRPEAYLDFPAVGKRKQYLDSQLITEEHAASPQHHGTIRSSIT